MDGPNLIELENGKTIKVRKLAEDDDAKGFFEVLDHLSPRPEGTAVPHHEFVECLRAMQSAKCVLVAEFEEKIVATVSVFIERKFIHHLGAVGHLEDLVVLPAFRGMGIGRALVRLCLSYCFDAASVARLQWPVCYKVILNTKASNVAYYAEQGFRAHETQMRIDYADWEEEKRLR